MVVDSASAEPGAFVLFGGVGGILVEVRDSVGGPWRKQVMYPSKALDFKVLTTNLERIEVLDPTIVMKRP